MKIGDDFLVKADLSKEDEGIDEVTGISDWMIEQRGKVLQIGDIVQPFGADLPFWYFDTEQSQAWLAEWITQVDEPTTSR